MGQVEGGQQYAVLCLKSQLRIVYGDSSHVT